MMMQTTGLRQLTPYALGNRRYVDVPLARELSAAVRSMGAYTEGQGAGRLAQEGRKLPGNSDRPGGPEEYWQACAGELRACCAYRPQIVGVFANQDPAEVMRIAKEVPLDIVQLSGTEGLDAIKSHEGACVVKVRAWLLLVALVAVAGPGRRYRVLLAATHFLTAAVCSLTSRPSAACPLACVRQRTG